MPVSGSDFGGGTRSPIMVETELFEHREVKPNFINPCCFGEDFATWLRDGLRGIPNLGVELSDPIQEDYGWGLWASDGKDRLWIALSFVGDGPQDPPAQWAISVVNDPGLNVFKRLTHKADHELLERVRAGVLNVIASNAGIRTIRHDF